MFAGNYLAFFSRLVKRILLRPVFKYSLRSGAADLRHLRRNCFFIISSIDLGGWKSVFKIILIGFVCFQPYTILTFLSGMRGAECSALIFPRGMPLIIGAVFLVIESCLWSLLCAVPILIFKAVLSKRNSASLYSKIL